VTPRSLADTNQHPKGKLLHPPSTLTIEAAGSCATLVDIYHTMQHYNPDNVFIITLIKTTV
jgi:hypothetical protein